MDLKIRTTKHGFVKSSHQRCSVKKVVIKIFAIFLGKHLCWSLFWKNCMSAHFNLMLKNFKPLKKNTYFKEHKRAVAPVLLLERECTIHEQKENQSKIIWPCEKMPDDLFLFGATRKWKTLFWTSIRRGFLGEDRGGGILLRRLDFTSKIIEF